MAAAPEDDARRTLAELEAKLRELEHELLRGREPSRAPVEAARPPAAPEPAPGEAPAAVLDAGALDEARALLGDLRDTIDALGATASRVTAEARAVIDEHGRTLARLERVGAAASRAQEAAAETGRRASIVVAEARPLASGEPRDGIEERPAPESIAAPVDDAAAVDDAAPESSAASLDDAASTDAPAPPEAPALAEAPVPTDAPAPSEAPARAVTVAADQRTWPEPEAPPRWARGAIAVIVLLVVLVLVAGGVIAYLLAR